MEMSTRRRINYKVEIDWQKVKHVRPKIDDKNITLEVKPTDSPLPRVMVITYVNDPIRFAFCVYSWVSVLYPKHLLNWVIIDSNSQLSQESLGSAIDDPRVRVVTKKYKNFNDAVKDAMELKWIDTPANDSDKTDTTLVPAVNGQERPVYYTLLECGGVWFPDTLGIKFRALDEGYDCVIPDTLAYYSPFTNTSTAHKLFLRFPRGGLYFKKKWWGSKSSGKIIGIPYLGDGITIGKPSIDAVSQVASVKFYENFPTDVKVMIRKILDVLNRRRDELSSESDGEDGETTSPK